MSNIKIETLTPIHIGSGNMLQNNSDFVVSKEDEESYIHIIDERKVLNLIGEEHIQDWLLSIEKKESTSDLVKRFASSSKIEDFSRQRVTCFASNINPSDTLKEIIHNGVGLPYIPGSSLKGAIRTAIMSTLVGKVEHKEEKIKVFYKIKAEAIEKELFGKDPNSDVFRFISIGDAYFGNDSVIALRMVNLNIRNKKDSLWDRSKAQIIEAIGTGEESQTRISIAKDYYRWVKNQTSSLGTLPVEIQSIPDLFMLINEHTRQLVEDEISIWKDINKTGADVYLEVMQEILNEINGCTPGKASVLRIGHASGWRFITGAWAENLNNFEIDVVKASRPNNSRYEEFDFPKSRRIDEDSDVLGFVKLTID